MTTAISKASFFDHVIIVGEDIDLLVLLTSLASGVENIHFQKSGKGELAEVLYSTTSFKHSSQDAIIFLHAFSGCDTTSALYGHGKKKFYSALDKSLKLQEMVSVFSQPDTCTEKIAEVGERFLVTLYGGDMETQTLDELRYHNFVKSAMKNKSSLTRLPPTRDAARYHSLRTYHQVQMWLGVEKNPVKWGWMRSSQGLTPITTTKDPAPQSLLKFISCTCKKGCSGACSCKKAGLKCSPICKHCNGQSCANVPEVFDSDDEDDDALGIIERMENRDLSPPETSTTDFSLPGPSKRKKSGNV